MNKKNVIIVLLTIAIILACVTIVLNLTFATSEIKLTNGSNLAAIENADGGQISVTVNPPITGDTT